MAEVEIKKKQDTHPGELCCSEEYYPWGTSLEFEGDVLDGLGIFDNVAVDQEVQIIATAKVTRKNENTSSDQDGEEVRRSLSLQLVKVNIPAPAATSLSDRLYRG